MKPLILHNINYTTFKMQRTPTIESIGRCRCAGLQPRESWRNLRFARDPNLENRLESIQRDPSNRFIDREKLSDGATKWRSDGAGSRRGSTRLLPGRAVMKAMLQIKKLDIAKLRAPHSG